MLAAVLSKPSMICSLNLSSTIAVVAGLNSFNLAISTSALAAKLLAELIFIADK